MQACIPACLTAEKRDLAIRSGAPSLSLHQASTPSSSGTSAHCSLLSFDDGFIHGIEKIDLVRSYCAYCTLSSDPRPSSRPSKPSAIGVTIYNDGNCWRRRQLRLVLQKHKRELFADCLLLHSPCELREVISELSLLRGQPVRKPRHAKTRCTSSSLTFFSSATARVIANNPLRAKEASPHLSTKYNVIVCARFHNALPPSSLFQKKVLTGGRKIGSRVRCPGRRRWRCRPSRRLWSR